MLTQPSADITLETIEIFNYNNSETLVWEGVGAHVDATTPDGVVNVEVFVVRKISGAGLQPVVVRVVGDNNTRVIDYIMYPPTVKESWIGAEHRDRQIEDLVYYLYGDDWPHCQEFITTDPGKNQILSLAFAVTEWPDIAPYGPSDIDRSFVRREAIPLAEMGTPPLQPTYPE